METITKKILNFEAECPFRKGLLSCFANLKNHENGLVFDEFLFLKWRNLTETWANETAHLYGNNPVDHIFGVLLSNKYRKSSHQKTADANFRSNLKIKIKSAIDKDIPLNLVLPSFPFKSGSFAKSQRRLPDLAEVASLCRLWELVRIAERGYKPGIKITILSDGRLLSHAFNINPYFTQIYLENLKKMINFLGMASKIQILELDALLTENYPRFYIEARAEAEFLKKTLTPEEIGQIYYSLRLNYDNTFWAQKFASMCLKDFSIGNADYFLKKHDLNVNESVFEYKAIWRIVEKSKVIDNFLPEHIRATPHAFKHDLKFTPHMISEKNIVLPWMGVGVIRRKGSYANGIVAAKYESELNMEEILPIFKNGEETPFCYITI